MKLLRRFYDETNLATLDTTRGSSDAHYPICEVTVSTVGKLQDERKGATNVHLLNVNEPLLAFSNLIVSCGIVLSNAQPRFMIADRKTSTFMGAMVCTTCLTMEPVEKLTGNYIYGLVEGFARSPGLQPRSSMQFKRVHRVVPSFVKPEARRRVHEIRPPTSKDDEGLRGSAALKGSEPARESVRAGLENCAEERTQVLADAVKEMETEVALCRNKQEMLRVLSLRLLRKQDEDRRRIARELHDSTGQILVALKMTLAKMQQDLEAHQCDPNLIKDADFLTDQALADIRTTSHLLHPPLLDEIGFASAAEWFVTEFQKRSGIKVSSRVPRVELPKHVELVLFRVLQEGLTNVLRHSGTTKAEVLLGHDEMCVRLSIRDFGRGMCSDLLEEFHRNGTGVGIGLAGMRERVRELGGDLQLRSNKSGLLVKAIIPKN